MRLVLEVRVREEHCDPTTKANECPVCKMVFLTNLAEKPGDGDIKDFLRVVTILKHEMPEMAFVGGCISLSFCDGNLLLWKVYFIIFSYHSTIIRTGVGHPKEPVSIVVRFHLIEHPIRNNVLDQHLRHFQEHWL